MNRVLVVDDHPLVALIMLEQARAAFPGAQVEIAGGVAEAIERARASISSCSTWACPAVRASRR